MTKYKFFISHLSLLETLFYIAVLIVGFIFWYLLIGAWSRTIGIIVGIVTDTIIVFITKSKEINYSSTNERMQTPYMPGSLQAAKKGEKEVCFEKDSAKTKTLQD